MTTPIEIPGAYRVKEKYVAGRYDRPEPNILRLAPPLSSTEDATSDLSERAVAILDLGEDHSATIVEYKRFTTVAITGPAVEKHYALSRDMPTGCRREFVVFDSNDNPIMVVKRGNESTNDPNVETLRQEFRIQGSALQRALGSLRSAASRVYQLQRYLPTGI